MKIDIGSKIKDISIVSSDNKKKLSDYLNKNLILYFYPRDLTPGCTTESNEFNDNLKKIKKLGWNVVGVSRDTLKSHQKFIDKYSFKFPLISDENEKVCKMFDVIKEKSLYGRKYMGIASGTSSRHLQSLSEILVSELKKLGMDDCRIEGKDSADWKLVDAHDVIVHLFHPEKREFYDLEKMWSEEIPKQKAMI